MARNDGLDRDILLAEAAAFLGGKYGLRKEEVVELLREEQVPLAIFTSVHTPFESVVLYLKSHLGLSFAEIGRQTGRDQRAIGMTHRRAVMKGSLPDFRSVDPDLLTFPLSIFRENRLSPAERVVLHLKRRGLSFSQIGRFLHRDERTVWTLHRRGMEKCGATRGRMER